MTLWLLLIAPIVSAQTTNHQFKDKKMKNKMILQTANKAVENGDYEGFLAFCAEDTKWNFVGDRILEGKEQVRQYMKDTYLEPPKFNVETIIEDGNFVTVMGGISLKNANGSYDHFDYCDNWRFENGKMAELKAFVVEKVPEFAANPSLTEKVTGSHFEEAIYSNDLTAVAALLKKGANVDLPTSKGLTPLMIAAGFGYIKLAELLISYGANVFVLDSHMGATALHKAVQSGNISIIQILIEKGAFINLQSPIVGNSPLMDAVLYKQENVVKKLLEQGARTELRNNFQETAIDIAKQIGIQSTIDLLEQHDKNISKIIHSQSLIKAIKSTNIKQVQELLDAKVSVNERIPCVGNYDDDYTPLGMAARDGQVEIVRLLLNAGADVRLLNGIMGATAVHEAAYAGHPEVIQVLMAHKNQDSKQILDINAQGLYNGMTALHDAVWQNNLEAVISLVNAGAALILTSHSGLTPRELAELYGHEDIAACLKEAEKAFLHKKISKKQK